MKKADRSLRICAALLVLSLFWRMLGAPVTVQDFRNLRIPARQAMALIPQRLERLSRFWIAQLGVQIKKPMQENTDSFSRDNEAIMVYLTQEERLVQMSQEGYVCGAVAAEMPAQYHMEALKAQAVAARTRLIWQKQQGGCSLHPGADICTDSTHCQGYATLAQCRERWGDSYEAYRDRLLEAQRTTQGEWIAYDHQPITVLYHAISGGRTEDVQTVFAQSLPYLVSVESENEEKVRGYQTEAVFTVAEIAERLNEAFPEMQLTADDVQRTFSINSYTQSGRVQAVQVGQNLIRATDLRRALDLRSTWFSISAEGGKMTFHQRGYGHGVGMSQAGANSMAAEGADYVRILQHYYTGVTIAKR